MKAREIREFSGEELEQKLKETKVELFNLRFQLATGQLSNPLKINRIKKDIARILTLKREKELRPSEESKDDTKTTKREKPVKRPGRRVQSKISEPRTQKPQAQKP